MSRFSHIQVAPPVEVFNVNKNCLDDSSPLKVNLSVGAYRTEEGKPWVLPVVREAEKILVNDCSQDHEYLPVLGYEPFSVEATRLLLGEDSHVIKEGRAFGIQCLSGTGSLRVGAEYLTRVCGYNTFYVSNPTWENHKMVFRNAGFTNMQDYRYWDNAGRKLDFDGLMTDLEAAPENSVIVLHACAHNPTGMDPTRQQWEKILDVVQRKKLFPFMDIAYQGFATGNPDNDAWAVRYFASKGVEMVVAQSFAKNFGLYNERIGNLTVIVNDKAVIPAIKSQITLLIRANWSNPPNHGAKIVHLVLSRPELKEQWFSHIAEMSNRIMEVRTQLRQHIEALGTPGSWDHITTQIGMFSYTGLTEKQVQYLTEKYHVYLLKSGRISMCGLTLHNVAHVAKGIHDAVTNA